jgi:ribosomal protein L11 methyltransferase
MNYVKLIFELKNPEEADILSALLADFPCQGFEENDRQLFAFFDEGEFDHAGIDETLLPFGYTYHTETVPHINWNAQWESNFEPIRINDEVGIRAGFHPAFTDCRYDIVITPKMSFGTGHHETTRMMLEFACETDFEGKSVLDFGCGTGVLAILAYLKGAHPVLGIDNDDWSIENARENCDRNHGASIEISGMDIQAIDQRFDIILANINLNVLLETLPKLKALLSVNGHIFLSGILASDIPKLSECFTGLGFTLKSQKQKKEWVALHII